MQRTDAIGPASILTRIARSLEETGWMILTANALLGIIAAYRDLARRYHPDKVANLPPEIREFADLKMKEINAVYAELKRRENRGHIITPGKANE